MHQPTLVCAQAFNQCVTCTGRGNGIPEIEFKHAQGAVNRQSQGLPRSLNEREPKLTPRWARRGDPQQACQINGGDQASTFLGEAKNGLGQARETGERTQRRHHEHLRGAQSVALPSQLHEQGRAERVGHAFLMRPRYRLCAQRLKSFARLPRVPNDELASAGNTCSGTMTTTTTTTTTDHQRAKRKEHGAPSGAAQAR